MSEISSLTRALTEGRISRRTFIGQAALLGLSMSAILALVEACTSSSSSGSGQKAKMLIALDTDIPDLDPNHFKSAAAYAVPVQTYHMPDAHVTQPGPNGTPEAT